MRLCAKKSIGARAFPFAGHEGPLVTLRIGPLQFLAEPAEALELAREIVAAVDELNGESGDR